MTEINNADLIVPVGGLTFGISSKYVVLTLVRLQHFAQEAQSTGGCLQGRATFASFSLILNLLLKCSSQRSSLLLLCQVQQWRGLRGDTVMPLGHELPELAESPWRASCATKPVQCSAAVPGLRSLSDHHC